MSKGPLIGGDDKDVKKNPVGEFQKIVELVERCSNLGQPMRSAAESLRQKFEILRDNIDAFQADELHEQISLLKFFSAELVRFLDSLPFGVYSPVMGAVTVEAIEFEVRTAKEKEQVCGSLVFWVQVEQFEEWFDEESKCQDDKHHEKD